MNPELLKQLRENPDLLKQAAKEAGLLQDDEAKELFSPIEADDMASAKEIAEKFNARLAKLEKWFTKKLDEKANEVTEKFENQSREAQTKTIREFAKTHPEMKQGSDVVAMMEQLYAKGNTDLLDIYKKSCISCDVVPVELDKDGGKVNLSTGNKIGDDGKEIIGKKTGEKKTPTSLRSDDFSADTEDLEDGELEKTKDLEGKSTRDIAAANLNNALADAGFSDIPE